MNHTQIFSLSIVLSLFFNSFAYASGKDHRISESEKKDSSVQPRSKPLTAQVNSAVMVKPTVKPIQMAPHTFKDRIDPRTNKVSPIYINLPYPYFKIDPKKTRCFFQGEALLIDPETSSFDHYVTYPLRPCIFGRIYDPKTKKSLVFHKAPTHAMKSLRQLFLDLSADPKLLKVTLFTCAMTKEELRKFGPYANGKTQWKEMTDIRDFLCNDFKINKDSIETRYLKDEQYKKYPALGQYELAPVTIAVSKTGEVYNTSIMNVDFFGVGKKAPPKGVKTRTKSIDAQPIWERFDVTSNVRNLVSRSIQSHYDTNPDRLDFDTRDFYTIDPIFNVPVSKYGDLLEVNFDNDMCSGLPISTVLKNHK